MFLFGRKKKAITRVVVKQKISPEMQTWLEMKNDKTYCALQADSARLYEEIEADYAVLQQLGITSNSQTDALEKKCLTAISTLEMLIPLWKKYNQPLQTICTPAKRLAMIREKQGRYEDAAMACKMALDLNMPQDGTAGGMRGRLARMVKKANMEITPEIQKYLTVE